MQEEGFLISDGKKNLKSEDYKEIISFTDKTLNNLSKDKKKTQQEENTQEKHESDNNKTDGNTNFFESHRKTTHSKPKSKNKKSLIGKRKDKHNKKKTNKTKENKPKSSKKISHIFSKKHQMNKHENSSSKRGLLSLIDQKKQITEIHETQPEIDVHDIEWAEKILDLKNRGIDSAIKNKEQWEEIEFYPLIDPFAYTIILSNTTTMERKYIVVQRMLQSKDEAIYKFICETLENYNVDFYRVNEKGKDVYLKDLVEEIIDDYSLSIDGEKKQILLYKLKRDLLGLEKLEPLMNDPNIEDISCDGAGSPIFIYHRKFGSIASNVLFDDEEELSSFVMKLAQKSGKHISIAHPMIDATMPDGSRIQMTLSTEVTTRGSTFTIRKFRKEPFAPADLISNETLSLELLAYFWMVVEHGYSALIAGGTASGKTSTLNAISLFIPRESKIVTIEETREINLPHPNWIPGVARTGFGQVYDGKQSGEIDMYDLMKAALRQRPEYILVGEIRGREAYVLFQAMATGHTTYSTMHADSSKSLIHRLEGEPINIPRVMLQALDVICIQTIARVDNKRARKIKQVIEIVDIDPITKEILTNEVFHWDPIKNNFEYSGKSYVLESIRSDKDYTKKELMDDLEKRKKILEYMVKNDIKDFRKVAQLTMTYREKPEEILKNLN